MRQIDKTLDKKRDAILHIKKKGTTFALRFRFGQKTIKIYNDEKNISAFQQEEKEQARFP